MSDVKVRIDADGGPAFRMLQQFRAALKEAGQQGREFSKIDFSQPSLARLADDMKAVNAEYEMLLRSSQSLRTHVKQTGQTGVAPWDLDVSRWHLSRSGAQRQREELARRLLRAAPLWFLDEPLTGLDRQGVELTAHLLAQHLADGGLAVLTTHQDLPGLDGVLRHLDLGA